MHIFLPFSAYNPQIHELFVESFFPFYNEYAILSAFPTLEINLWEELS